MNIAALHTPRRWYIHMAAYIMLAVIMGFKSSGSTPSDFSRYFTTWMWVALCVFMWLSACAHIAPEMWPFVAGACYFVTFGCTFLVYVLFTAVVYSNSDALLRFVGPDLSFGELFLGERVTHGIPVITMCCYSFANADVLKYTLRNIKTQLDKRSAWYFPLLVCYWYIMPLGLIGVYGALHDPWSTYRSRLTYMESFIVSTGTLLLVISIPVYVFIYKKNYSTDDTGIDERI